MRQTLMLFSLFACACGGAPAVSPPDLADPCAPIGRSIDGACVSQLDFVSGPALPRARDHHGTAIAEVGDKAFLYVTGGTNYHSLFSDVAAAPIDSQGGLGAFVATTPLPTGLAGHGIVAHGGRLFVVSGQAIGGTFTSSVSSATINPDGTLGAWQDEPPLSEGRFHLAVTATDTHVYAVGGVISPNHAIPFIATKTVWSAPFLPDGHLGPWTQHEDLPEPRSHHAIVAHEGFLYVVGGLIQDTNDGSPVAHEVLVSKLGPDGAPGPFTVGGTFEEPTSTLSTFDLQGFLYAVGGLTEDDLYSDRIRRAPYQPDGTLGAFTDVGTLPAARSHVHQTPYRDGHLYSMGGSIDYEVVTDEVWVGTFSPPASPLPTQSLRLHTSSTKKGTRCSCAKQARISIPR